VLVSERGDEVEDLDGLFLGDAVFFSDSASELGFGEGFSHIFYSQCCWLLLLLSPKSHETCEELKTFGPFLQAKK
jgi:hypothetical protein